MRRLAILLAFLAALAGSATAATDGTRGPNSTASIDVSTTVQNAAPDIVRVSGLTDLDFGQLQTGPEFVDADPVTVTGPVCLYHTSPTFALTVTQQGRGLGDAFELRGPNGGALPIQVGFSDYVSGPSAFDTIGFAVRGLVANRVSATCETGPISLVGVNYSPTPQRQPTGQYSAVISVVMAAE